MKQENYDAIIVGAGFGGIYQLHKLVNQGLNVLLIDQAEGVGGTWFWNRYPGAMSDTEAYLYRFSWDKDDLKHPYGKDHYVKQPEVLAYLQRVVEQHGLSDHIQFNTQLQSAEYDDKLDIWRVSTSTKENFRTRYLITALGLLSRQNYPKFPGIEKFKGELYHTGAWPKHHDFKNKKVGVIGNGSTGVQIITAIAGEVKELTCFQRHPQYSVPSGDGPVSKEYRDQVIMNYEEIWNQARESAFAFGFEESTVPAMSVSEEERNRKFQEAWDKGNGFRFMFWTFSDLTTNPEANEAACNFIRQKIRDTVEDPEKARKLSPRDFYARRPLCDAGYYQQFNRPNVDIVDLQATPITHITETGIELSDNTHHDLDVIILATGFDAVDGNYTRIAIKGRNGESLADHWTSTGPTAYLGMCVPNFPDLFMIAGPNSPFANIPLMLEAQVDFISQMIERSECSLDWSATKHNGRAHSIGSRPVVEVTAQAERDWVQLCNDMSKESLFRKTPSWIFGANIPGKKFSTLFYFGGLKNYRAALKDVLDGGNKGFLPL